LSLVGVGFIILTKNHDGLFFIVEAVADYLTSERSASFISFFAIIVGVYTTVWVILSTSVSKFGKIILRERIDRKLLFVIASGLIESSFVILMAMFVPSLFDFYEPLLLLFVMLALITFVKFICTLILLTKLNIESTVAEFDEADREKLECKIKIDSIYENTKK